jgi:DNA-binding NtrC family response regulator
VKHDTILYMYEQATRSDSVSAALKADGYEVVSTNSAKQAVALLFILHSVAAVVLNQRARERAGFDVAQSLRAIRPNVPIVLLCRDQIDRLSSNADACVSAEQVLEKLNSAVGRPVAPNRVPVLSGQR